MNKTLSRLTILALFILLFSLNSCSAIIMASRKTPDLSKLNIDSTREEVEKELGRPAITIKKEDGNKTATYRYTAMDRSEKFYQAAELASYSLCHLFLAEPVWMLYAIIYSNTKSAEIEVTYNAEDRVVLIDHYPQKDKEIIAETKDNEKVTSESPKKEREPPEENLVW